MEIETCHITLIQQFQVLLDGNILCISKEDSVHDLVPHWMAIVYGHMKNGHSAEALNICMKQGGTIHATLLDALLMVLDSLADETPWEAKWNDVASTVRNHFHTEEAILKTMIVCENSDE